MPALSCDVSDREQVERLAAGVLSHYGGVDILMNKGVIQVGPVDAMSVEDLQHAMDAMFRGTVYPTMALLCARFAVVGFSEGLRAELAGRGIQVVTIAPGLMLRLPLVSLSARRAARQIVSSASRGEAERIPARPANPMARFHGLSERAKKRGHELKRAWKGAAGAVTVPARRAARQYLRPQGPAPARHDRIPAQGRHS